MFINQEWTDKIHTHTLEYNLVKRRNEVDIIYNMDEYYGPTDSEKEFKVVIECDLTLGRAENILDYIRQQLEYTDEIELWSIWLGDYDQKISWYEAKIQEFTAEDLVEIAELPVKQQPLKHHCVRIRK